MRRATYVQIGGELGDQILQAGRDDHEVTVIKLVVSKDPPATGNPSLSVVAEP